MNTTETRVLTERPLSEGDQIKTAIRTLFETSREGYKYTREDPLMYEVTGVNGTNDSMMLCLYRPKTIPGGVVMWYDN